MAASVLASFSASMLGEVAKHHFGDHWNADKNITERRASLDKQLLELKETLKNIDGTPVQTATPSDWLDKLEQCRYDLEDIQESLGLPCNKEILTKLLDTMIKHVAEMHTEMANVQQGQVAGLPETRLTMFDPECIADEDLINREEDIKEIIRELTTAKVGVSIIGIGGIGKTQLAKAIKVEPRIQSYFDSILSLTQFSNLASEFIKLMEQSGKPSNSQKVLIVLDDVHSVDLNVWRRFKKQLNSDSRVLITTQNPDVANVTGTSKYCLPPLPGTNCISLIRSIANENIQVEHRHDRYIKRNEKDLVDRCKGLPLLAIQIGLLLSTVELDDQGKKIQDILAISSWKMPGLRRVLISLKPVPVILQCPNLRRCLAYCSLFPQDYEFTENYLVQLWMAEGFAPPSRDAAYLENIAREYFRNLFSYSLFQASESLNGEKPRYKLHGLFYDMALNLASKIFCQRHIVDKNYRPEISEMTRHFSLRCENAYDIDTDPLLEFFSSCSGLRTFFLVYESGKRIKKNPTFFYQLKRLRVLDLSHTNLTKLEKTKFSKLIHLRYLDLSFTPVKLLPKLSKSPRLQVLKLNHCDNLYELPSDLTNLTSLISLQVNQSSLPSLPSCIGKLTALQRLSPFIVEKTEGFKITELGNLNNLRYSLRITKLENVETEEEAREAKLLDKIRLAKLELEWSSPAQNAAAIEVLQGLEPNVNLDELVIKNYSGAIFPDWLSKFEEMNSIHLISCQALPSPDQLPMLTTFCVEAMKDIVHHPSGRNGTSRSFKRIKTLVLCNMSSLTKWIELAANSMSGLRNLRVQKCQSLIRLPQLDCLKSMEKLELIWCTALEKLPRLPKSLKTLIINGSRNLTPRCQVGGADRRKIRDIQVVIDSKLVDTSEPYPTSESNQSTNIQGTPNRHQNTSPHPQFPVTGEANSAWLSDWLGKQK